MGSDAVFRNLVHVPGLDLHFQRMSAVAQHRGVQRLVHVLLGRGNVVVELAGNWTPHPVRDAEGGVAIGNLVDDYAEGVQVVDVAKLLALGRIFLDLVVYGVDALGTAAHIRVETIFRQLGLEVIGDFIHVGFALRSPCGQHPGNLTVSGLVQVPEGQVVKLPLQLPDPEPVGQG